MLDAYIIDRIRHERGHDREERPTLHIEVPRQRPGQEPAADRSDKEERDRGAVIVDYKF